MTLSTCDVLLNLVPSLQVDILVRWLSLKDVGKLDSAICSTLHRELLLNIFKEEFCVFQEPSTNNFGLFLWINHRRIKMADVEVPRPFSNPTLHPTFFEVTGKYLRRLNASSMLDIVEADNANNILSEKLAMLRTCVNLRKLKLGCVDLRSLDIGPLLATFSHLSHLDLSRCKNVSSEVVLGLTGQAKNLQVLNLSNCHVSSVMNVALLSPNHTIHTLRLGTVKDSPAFVSFALQCKALRALYVEGIQLSDVCRLLTQCPTLRVLSARVEPGTQTLLTAEEADTLIPLIQNIEYLHLYNLSGRYVADEQLLNFVANSLHLKALVVTFATHPDGTALDDILNAAMSVPVGSSGHQLNTLYVESITSATLQSVVHCCPQLTTLVCRNARAGADIHSLMTIIGQSAITSLSLVSSDVIPSADLLHLHNLSQLKLDCNGLTDKDVMGIVDRNPRLRVLSLTDAPQLTKKSLLYIVKNCKYLEELKFDNQDSNVPYYKRTMADTSLLMDIVLFFRPKLKKLTIQLVYDISSNKFNY